MRIKIRLVTAVDAKCIGYFAILFDLAENKDPSNISYLNLHHLFSFKKCNDFKKFEIKQIHETPLHCAVDRRNYEIIDIFLNQKDINVNIKNTILKKKLIRFFLRIYDFF